MLSEQFVRDNSLDMYMEVLKLKFIDERKSGWKKMFFVPAAYYNLLTHEGTKGKYKSTAFRFVRNIDQYEYFAWPVNIGNYHWALVYHALTSGSPLFYLDSWGTVEQRKSRMTGKMEEAINEFFKRYHKSFKFTEASFVKVPDQYMNDCGPVVNELMRRLMMNESVIDFTLDREVGVKLRITQTTDILTFITNKGQH